MNIHTKSATINTKSIGNDDGYRKSKTEVFEEMQLEHLIIRYIVKLHIPPMRDDRINMRWHKWYDVT